MIPVVSRRDGKRVRRPQDDAIGSFFTSALVNCLQAARSSNVSGDPEKESFYH